jgi:hypothetical protein
LYCFASLALTRPAHRSTKHAGIAAGVLFSAR